MCVCVCNNSFPIHRSVYLSTTNSTSIYLSIYLSISGGARVVMVIVVGN